MILPRPQTLRTTATLCVLVEIGIHSAMTPDHLAEKLYISALFLIGSAVLCLVVLGLGVPGPTRSWAWLLGAATCLVMFVLFIVSRTAGLPGGYLETWLTDDGLGVISLPFDAIFVACAVASLQFRRGRNSTAAWRF